MVMGKTKVFENRANSYDRESSWSAEDKKLKTCNLKGNTFGLHPVPARYTELGTYPYLETLTLFVRPPTAVYLGRRLLCK